jgi:hypothetical protein
MIFDAALAEQQQREHLVLSDYSDLGIQVAHNVFQNVQQMDELYLPEKNLFQGIPAIICGAGPSLEQAIDRLKSLQTRALLFSGGAGLTALEHFGICPHFAGGIDPYPACQRLQLQRSRELPFFFQSRVASDLLQQMQGPKLWFPSSGHFPLEQWVSSHIGLPVESFDGGWNVATFLTAVAVYLGCAPIVLVGVDLAGEAYAGAVVTGEGKKRDWKMAAEWLQNFALQHGQIGFSLEGFGGVDRLPGLEGLYKRPFHPLEQESCYETFNKSLLRVQDICLKLVGGGLSPKEDFLLQFELEEELAYQVFGRPVWEAWQSLFKGEEVLNKSLFLLRQIGSFYASSHP